MDVPEPSAVFPLTAFDRMLESTTFVTGWLVKGTLDTDALAAALKRVATKWRMLSGRVQSIKDGSKAPKWVLKIPLGDLPPDYPSFSLTISVSDVPLSKHVKVPVPMVSSSLPPAMFIHSSTPRQYTAWEESKSPITCWNVVHFPAEANNGSAYTAIGFARCHGIFDGGGAVMVTRALVAELQGNEWSVPSLPSHGINVNPIDDILSHELAQEEVQRKFFEDYTAYVPMNAVSFSKLVAWHVKERLWNGADRTIILLPKAVLTSVVDEVKEPLRKEGRDVGHLTTGDIMVAWMFKTVFSQGTSPETVVHCTNLADFRSLLVDQCKEIASYPHNAFIPLPYPLLSVASIQEMSIGIIANLFAMSRASLNLGHVLSAYKQVQQPVFPNPPEAKETLMISNVSASRILQTDWTAAGSKGTLCGYRYQVTPKEVLFTNAIYIAGRLDDGSIVLDVSLNKKRLGLLVGDIQRRDAKLARTRIYARVK